jgi:hypothetical protein
VASPSYRAAGEQRRLTLKSERRSGYNGTALRSQDNISAGDNIEQRLRVQDRGITMRERLPNRRNSVTCTGEWHGRSFYVSVGLSPDGRPLEVFARDARPDTDRDLIFDDFAVVVSHALQRGATLEALAAGLGRLPPDGSPSSVLGEIIDAACSLTQIRAA